MSTGIRKRKLKDGTTVYDVKYEAPRDPQNPHQRRTRWKTVRGTKKAAEKERRRLLGAIDTGQHVDPSKITLAAWMDEWLESYARPRVTDKTLERYRELVRLHVQPNVGHIRLQQVQGKHLHGLYADLQHEDREPRPLSGRTCLQIHRVVSKSLKDAVRARMLPRNPAEDVDAPRTTPKGSSDPEGESSRIRALSQDEVSKLLAGFRDHASNRASFLLVAVGVATGLRRGELLALRWSDIDLERMTLRVVRAVEHTNAGLTIKPPKNASSRRTIGFDDGLAGLLRRELTRQKKDSLKLGVRIDPSALVFPASPDQPTTLRNPRTVSHQFVRIAKSVGFPGLRLHDLRHTHATALLDGGIPVHAVAQRLGHSTPVVTMTTYAHVMKRSEDRAVSVTGDWLSGAFGLE